MKESSTGSTAFKGECAEDWKHIQGRGFGIHSGVALRKLNIMWIRKFDLIRNVELTHIV
jgi:hypothetical protein